jgi:transposase
LESNVLTQHKKYARRGKPTADTPIKAILWQIEATITTADDDVIIQEQRGKACFVLGTSIPDAELSDLEVIAGYKGQGAVERGFRFLKAPEFFVSSFLPQSAARHHYL